MPDLSEFPPVAPGARAYAYKDWMRIGFFVTLGAALFAVLALAINHLWEASLRIAAPFVLAIALALLLDPVVDRLERAGMRRGFAVSLVFLVFVGAIAGLLWLGVPALVGQAQDLTRNGPTYIQRLRGTTNEFLHAHPRILGMRLPRNFDAVFQPVSDRASQWVSGSAAKVTGYLINTIEAVLQTVITLIVTFYLLLDIDRLRARLFYLAPERWRQPMSLIGQDIGGVVSNYLRGLLIVSALYGAATFVLLLGMGLVHRELYSYALIVGFAGGLLYTVPYIGPLLTSVITFLVCFAAGGVGFGGAGILATLILNQIFDNGIAPRILGGGVGLNPVMSIFALTLGGTLFGLWGLLLSVPIAASIQAILFRFFPKLTTPTPPAFLRAQGVRPDEPKSAEILKGDDAPDSPPAAPKPQDE
jgi:predicted PurR-regulated permease PerM